MELKGCAAIVTGGSGGLGQRICRALAREGVNVVVNYAESEAKAKSVAGEILGTDNAHQKMHTLLCQEYLLQGERVIYRIRPKDDKHPVLLPVGEKAQFRMDKDHMRLRSRPAFYASVD